jgi:hypothetical protein
MLTRHLRHALRSPLPSIADGYRHFRQHGASIRRARMLCQCADGLRLRRMRGWEQRSSRLYRGSVRALGALARPDEQAAQDSALAARHALRRARAPYRALLAALARLAFALATAALVIVLAACALSPAFRARLFPRDLAAGRPWTASDADFGISASGMGPSSEENYFFHTSTMRNPSVEIDLGDEHVVRGVRIENRPDCCQERALPLNVEIWDGKNWQLVAQRRTAFSVWKYDIGPVRTRKMRFLHPATSYFHLKRISIYGQ